MRSILVTGLCAVGALALSACGQKGDLFLPAAKPSATVPAASSPAPATAPARQP